VSGRKPAWKATLDIHGQGTWRKPKGIADVKLADRTISKAEARAGASGTRALHFIA